MSKPLWQEIDRAWWSLVNTDEPHCNPPASDQAACVIRAVANWLLPEEEPPETDDRLARDWTIRMRLRDRLIAEADRAERGEVEQ